MNLRTIVAPACEPITVVEAKLAALIDSDYNAQDDYVTGLIAVARELGEQRTNRAFVERVLEATFEGWPAGGVIELPMPVLQGVVSITYVDDAGVTQTLAADQYQVDTSREPGRVKAAYGVAWPSVRSSNFNAVVVRYIAGYAAVGSPTSDTGRQAAVPDGIKLWMKQRIKGWYEHREPVAVGTIVSAIPRDFVDGLLDPYRVWNF